MVSNKEALKARLPVWSKVNAISSINLKYVLTSNLAELLSSINGKSYISVQSVKKPAFRKT